MNPGQLRHKVYLQALTRTEDEFGGGEETWDDASGPLWAEVKPLSGTEAIRAMQTETSLTHAVRMRYRPGVTTRMRLRYGARHFDIQRVIDVQERHIEIQLLCEEIQ